MGNYRFRLSDMIPNAWFYKLRDMSKTRSTQNPNSHKKLPFPPLKPTKSSPNSSSAKNLILTSFDHTHSYNPPRKSFKKWAKRRTVYVPSPKKITPASVCNMFHDFNDFTTSNLDEGFQDTDHDSFHAPNCSNQAFWSSPGACKLTSSATDIIIDVDKPLSKEPDFTIISEPKLPPILTRPKPPTPGLDNQDRLPSKKTRTPGAATARKSVSRPTGGVRINRAKVAGKKPDSRARKSVKGERKEMYNAERLAIVKSSFDPERDFRESMMEMIEENNIRASKEMEELLACYLSLNSNHYHHIIIKAFQQIWLNFPQQALD